MKSDARIIKALMWFVSTFHIVVGLGLNADPGFADTMAKLYGAHVEEWSPQFIYILHPLGAFMLALGVLAALAALDPVRYRPIIYVFSGLFILRALHRLVLGPTASAVFGISSGRNLTNMAFFFALAAALIIADRLSHRSAGQAEKPAGA